MSAQGKVIVVTGAARNIGFYAAAHLANAGAKVVLTGRSQDKLNQARDKIGGDAIAVAGDITNATDVDRIFKTAADHFGGVDGIVNNAGTAYPNRVENLDVAQVQEQIAINFLAPILTCRAAIPYLRARKGGRIVNVSSAAAHMLDTFGFLSIYGATKAGLERFTDELRNEVRGDNIAVTTFIPGDTSTGFGDTWDPAITAEAYKEWTDLGRWFGGMMKVEEVGKQVAHCFSLPADCTFDMVMMRPVGRVPKVMESDLKKDA